MLSKDLLEKLLKEFPFIEDLDDCAERTGETIPICVGGGWSQLIYDMCTEIKNHGDAHNLDSENLFFEWLAESDGGVLEYFIFAASEEWLSGDLLDNLLEKYVARSKKTCSECGRDGSQRRSKDNAFKVLCEVCAKGELHRDDEFEEIEGGVNNV